MASPSCPSFPVVLSGFSVVAQEWEGKIVLVVEPPVSKRKWLLLEIESKISTIE